MTGQKIGEKVWEIGALLVILSTAMVVFFVTTPKTEANPSAFSRQNNGVSITATSSVSYMSFGTASTTYYYDSQANGNSGAADSASVLWQMTATSSNATQDMYVEYAQGGNADCIATPMACDWYSHATSTTPDANAVSPFARLRFSSSTPPILGADTAPNNRNLREFAIPMPTRYARVIFVVPYQLYSSGTASSSAVWAEIVAKKQR